MILYTKDNKKIEFNSKENIIGGNTTTIYKYNDELLKVLNDSMWMNLDLFKTIRSINNKNFIKINNYYKKHFLYHNVDAYTVEFIESINSSKILFDLDYLIDNLNEIDKLIDIFTSEFIMMYDFCFYNVMYTDDNIVIIDPDMYFRIPNRRVVGIYNKKIFLNLIRDMLKMEFIKIGIDSSKVDLLVDDIDYKKNIPLQLTKKLNGKRIIDNI